MTEPDGAAGPADDRGGVDPAGGSGGEEADGEQRRARRTATGSGTAGESPRVAFMQALSVPRNARIGAIAGLALAVAVYVVFVVLPEETTQDPLLLVVLAFVVAVSTALLVATALTVRQAARMTMSPPKWIRRGGRVAVVGGGGWAALAVLSAPTAAGVAVPDLFARAYGLALPFAPLGLAYAAWAVHATGRNRESYPGPVGGLGWAAATVGFLLASWLAAVDHAAFLGLPTPVAPETYFGILLLPALGTSLLGAAALRAGVDPRDGPVGLLFALPVSLGLLTAVAGLDAGGFSFLALGLPAGLAWANAGRHLAAGRGVPSEADFRASLAGRFPGGPPEAGDGPDT